MEVRWPLVPPAVERTQNPVQSEPTIRPQIAAAQMRRDRRRLEHAQQEILALQAQATRFAGGQRHYILHALRLIFHRLPPGVQKAIRRWRPKRSSPVAGVAAMMEQAGGDAPVRGRALVIDDHWPRPDRDVGSIEIVNLAKALTALGFDVVLAAGLEHCEGLAARNALVSEGIRCLSMSDAPSVEAFLAQQGNTIDLCVLCRVYCGGRFLEAVQRSARKARIVFHSIDLHFLRLERQAVVEGGEAAAAIARQVRAREVEIMRSSDATVVVSDVELRHLEAAVPDVLAVRLPLARSVMPPATSFRAQSGIGFIGSFVHAPNSDAIRYFLAEIWPHVLRNLPDVEMTIVGADCPNDLLDGVAGRVRVLGHVPDIGPWFEGLRLTVTPLRFGAGA